MATLFELATEVNKTKSVTLARQLKLLAKIIGFLQRDPQEFLHADQKNGMAESEIVAKIATRTEAKLAKDFAESDRIRAELLANNILLEDKPGGITEWRRA
jgi:cysteinyl-tRNA synthetase